MVSLKADNPCNCPPNECREMFLAGYDPMKCVNRLDGEVITKKCESGRHAGYSWHHNGICLICKDLTKIFGQ